MSRAQTLANRYRLTRAILKGDATGAIPWLYVAADAGDVLHVKIWRRAGADDEDLRSIWNHEVRSLLRLGGYPRADEYFVKLRDLGVDKTRYFVVLETEHRSPLSESLENRNQHQWLRNLGQIGRRRALWEGLSRVAEGLAILHDEGTLHRRLSAECVFTGQQGECDFRLSGFEWSLRVSARAAAGARATSQGRFRAPELDQTDALYSTATDWFDFGILSAEVFGIQTFVQKKRRLTDVVREVNASQIIASLERALILDLLTPDAASRLSRGPEIMMRVAEIVAGLKTLSAAPGRKLYVGFSLGPNSRLSQAIWSASKGRVALEQVREQLEFISKDLEGERQIVARTAPNQRFILRGHKLEYGVDAWSPTGSPTWDLGHCRNVEAPRIARGDQVFSVDGRRIVPMTASSMRREASRLRSMSAPWTSAFPTTRRQERLDDGQKEVLDFFRVTNQLDALLSAAQVWPVELVNQGEHEDERWVDVTPRTEPNRNELASYLGLPPTDEQMGDYLNLGVDEADREEEELDDVFSVSNEGTLRFEDEAAAKWSFTRGALTKAGPVFRFSTLFHVSFPPRAHLYLSRNLGGTVALLRRRNRAIEGLASHAALLSTLSDPLSARREIDAGDSPDVGDLDESKREAMSGIWATQPLYLVQGPPGTGKTRLIESFVGEQLASDPATQILITAHSNHVVDEMKRKVKERLTLRGLDPIVIRLDKDDDSAGVPRTSAELARGLAASDMARRAPEALRRRLDAVARDEQAASPDIRSLRALVQQAANVTIATSNSGDLARMSEQGRRFDWSVMDEAGKAHGSDLALALQASHRLLMIGDHKQLPPFNSETFKKLLGEPLRVRKAIDIGVQFAPGLVDRSVLGTDDDDELFAARSRTWADMVDFFGNLFERSERQRSGRLMATPLWDQHRMRPEIAKLVSECFYERLLETAPEALTRFDREPSPFLIAQGSWLPPQPLVFVDVPYLQKERFAQGETTGLYVSNIEAEAVCEVLEQLRPQSGNKCHVQVLSPYRAQLKKIRSLIQDRRQRGSLSYLSSPEFEMQGKRLGATVDEFQGSEADIVVVSLVRNNALPAGKGIGFLKDPRRVNVLLSRARHKLVIVGSREFLRTRIDWSGERSEHEPLLHIRDLVLGLDDAEKSGRLGIVRVDALGSVIP